MRYAVILVLLSSIAAPAGAQPPNALPQFYVSGIGGIASGDQHSPMVAGQAGWRLVQGLYVTGEVGLIDNVLSATLHDEIDIVGRLLSLQQDAATSFDAHLHSRYVAGGVRWTRPVHRIAIFAEGGVGTAFLDLSIGGDRQDGSHSEELEAELRHDAPDSTSGMHLMGIVGGGITISVAARWQVDGGYRYSWITSDPAIHVQVPYGALRFTF